MTGFWFCLAFLKPSFSNWGWFPLIIWSSEIIVVHSFVFFLLWLEIKLSQSVYGHIYVNHLVLMLTHIHITKSIWWVKSCETVVHFSESVYLITSLKSITRVIQKLQSLKLESKCTRFLPLLSVNICKMTMCWWCRISNQWLSVRTSCLFLLNRFREASLNRNWTRTKNATR